MSTWSDEQEGYLAQFAAWGLGFTEESDYRKWALAAEAALGEIARLNKELNYHLEQRGLPPGWTAP